MPNRSAPVKNVLTEIATITLMTMVPSSAPFAASPAATVAASTLITATAGVSGPASAGTRLVVSDTTTPVTTVPMIRAANPSGNPAAIEPWKINALKEIQ